MTREDIIAMARETGVEWLMHNQFYKDHLQHFAALVAAAERNRTWTQEHWTEYERSIAAAAKAEEREACAKVKAPNRRKLRPGRWVPLNEQQLLDEQQACFNEGWRDGVAFIRAAIRARSNT